MGEGPEKRAAHNTGARQAPTQGSPHSCHHAEMSPLKESIVTLGFRGITVSWHRELYPQSLLPPLVSRESGLGEEKGGSYQAPTMCQTFVATLRLRSSGWPEVTQLMGGRGRVGTQVQLGPEPSSLLPHDQTAVSLSLTLQEEQWSPPLALQGVRAEPCWGPGV